MGTSLEPRSSKPGQHSENFDLKTKSSKEVQRGRRRRKGRLVSSLNCQKFSPRNQSFMHTHLAARTYKAALFTKAKKAHEQTLRTDLTWL